MNRFKVLNVLEANGSGCFKTSLTFDAAHMDTGVLLKSCNHVSVSRYRVERNMAGLAVYL